MCVVVLGLCCLPVVGKPKQIGGMDSVPPNLQASLLDGLNRLVYFQTKHQWGNLYDLLAKSWTKSETKDQFQRDESKNNSPYYTGVRSFQLHDVLRNSASYVGESQGEWTLLGCSKMKGDYRRFESVIYADQVHGEWKFSPMFIFHNIDEPPTPCGR